MIGLSKHQNLRLDRALEKLESLSSKENFDASVTVADDISIKTEDAILKGHGTTEMDGRVVATICGVVERVNKLVYVRALRARYKPEIGDIIVGRVIEVAPKRWRLEINFSQDAVLMLSSMTLPDGIQRRRTAVDELNMRSVFEENDVLCAEVRGFQHDGCLHLQARSQKYGKLKSGQLLSVPPYLLKKCKQHFHHLDQYGVHLILGCNGFIWIGEHVKVRDDMVDDRSDKSEEQNISWNMINDEESEEICSPLETRQHICRTANAIRVLSTLGFMITMENTMEVVNLSAALNVDIHEMLGAEFYVVVAEKEAERRSSAEAKILRGPHEDLESYLEAVDQLRSITRFFSSNKNLKSSIGVINQANTLHGKAIFKLEEEFRQLLTSYSKPMEPDRLTDCLPNSTKPSSAAHGHDDSVGPKSSPEHLNKSLETVVRPPPALIPPRIIPLLHDIAQQMIQAGHKQQLLNIYREARASAIELTLRKLGVERLGKEDVQKMQWEVLETNIGGWINLMRVVIKVLFACEKKICDEIFEGHDTLRDQCFSEVTANSVTVLLSFGEAIAKSKRSPEKLFVLLDMYEIMRELHSEMDTIIKSKYCGEMREAVVVLTKRLAQTARETFSDFEEAVEKDATKTAVLDGTVHPLTSYVINYMKFLFDYQSTLKQLFGEFGDGDVEEQLASITTRIMQALQSNLDGKSKLYKDPSLTQLFLMKNIHYIVRSVRRSEAKDVLGDDWVQINRRVVQQHANQYKRISWSKILQCLSVQGMQSGGSGSFGEGGSTSGVSRAMVKDRFKNFNMLFEELHQRQSQWTVPDSELRESLRLAVAEVLLPAYRSFIKRFGPLIEGGKNPQKYIRYSPEDLERMLAEFFEGKTWNEPRR